jgi:hypothetical protein
VTRIWVTWRAPGFHRWLGAEGKRRYLADRHRHVFHFKVALDVRHNDREVEFHDLLDHCRAITRPEHDWDLSSCEDIAKLILIRVAERWPDRRPQVSVSEDGECGAVVS